MCYPLTAKDGVPGKALIEENEKQQQNGGGRMQAESELPPGQNDDQISKVVSVEETRKKCETSYSIGRLNGGEQHDKGVQPFIALSSD